MIGNNTAPCKLRVAAQVGFITGVPASVHINQQPLAAAEINFLCVHKKLRAKRLTPLLIKEVTRRVNLTGVWQAVYTAGVVIPRPVATCRYYHRSINPKKLVEVGFSSLNPRTTMVRMIKLNKLPEQPQTPGVCYSIGCHVCQRAWLRSKRSQAIVSLAIALAGMRLCRTNHPSGTGFAPRGVGGYIAW